LGELNHVVALAMGSRRILGWSAAGRAVPYHKSEAGIKLRCAASAVPVPRVPDAPPMGVAGWEVVRACLWKLLAQAEKRGKEMQLPNVTRLFRSEFNLVLSETALGHERLQDLLQDPCLEDICVLRKRAVGHHVVVERAVGAIAEAPLECPPMRPPHRTAPPAEAAPALPRQCTRQHLCSLRLAWKRRTSDSSTVDSGTSDGAPGSTTDLSVAASDHRCCCTPARVYKVVNTFVHVPSLESTAPSAARRVHRTVPPSTRLARGRGGGPAPEPAVPAPPRGFRARSSRGDATSSSVAVSRAR